MARNDVETVTTDARAALGDQYDTALARQQIADYDHMRQAHADEWAAHAQMVQERFGGDYALADDERGIQPLTYAAMGTAMDLAAVKGLVTLGAGLVGRAVSRLPAPRMVVLPGGKVVPASKAGYVEMPSSVNKTAVGRFFAPVDVGTRAEQAAGKLKSAHEAWVQAAREPGKVEAAISDKAAKLAADKTAPVPSIMQGTEGVKEVQSALQAEVEAKAALTDAANGARGGFPPESWKKSPFRLNDESHIWRFGEAKAHGSPYIKAHEGPYRFRGFPHALLNPTGSGLAARMMSHGTRTVLRELSPWAADVSTPVGSFLHWLTSPTAFSMLTMPAYGKLVVWPYLVKPAARKLGWEFKTKEDELAEENAKLAKDAERNARPAGSGRPAITPPPSYRQQNPVDAAVDLDVIRQQHVDFHTMATTNRPAAVAQFNAWYANASPEVQARIATDVEKRALAIHYPQFMSSYGDLNRTDKGRAFLEDFRKRVIRSRSMGEWFGTDWSVYGRWLRQQRAQHEGGR